MDSDEELRSDEEFEETLSFALVGVAASIGIYYFENYMVKEPCRDSSYKGHRFIMDILEGNDIRCHELFRMEHHVFVQLCQEFRVKNLLKDSREVTVEEQMAIFLMTIGHNERNRMLQERFQHSGETISRHFNRVLKAVVIFSMSIIVPPSFNAKPDHILHNPKYWPHFKGCIGAIDGTHVDAVIPVDKQVPYRGRKGNCTQNVMAACSFDMRFTFVWAGWEGTAHDSRIFIEAIRMPDLNFPKPTGGKYYVVDAGYPNMSGFLAPYKGVRYHLQDFRSGSQARGVRELFNHTHSSLRNVIERCFGVWKARWPILKRMAPYPFETQRLIVVASMAIHNYTRQKAIADAEFRRYDEDEGYISDDEDMHTNADAPEPVGAVDQQQRWEMSAIRDGIANSILMSRN